MVLKFHLILIDDVPSTQLQFNILLGNRYRELRDVWYFFAPRGSNCFPENPVFEVVIESIIKMRIKCSLVGGAWRFSF